MSISSLARIAASSLVEAGAIIGAHVTIGPFCVIAAGVVIGEGTAIGSHSVINGLTTIGRDNTFGQYSSIGEVNQDLKYANEPTTLVIGDRNQIGKNATFHRGTVQGRSATLIGNDNLFLDSVHIGHDCVVGNGTQIGDNSGLAGHVELDDEARIGFMCAIHQFCVLGVGARIVDRSAVVQDVPPFVIAKGNRAVPAGINATSKTFLALEKYQQDLIHTFYDMLYHQSLALEEVKQALKIMESDYPVMGLFDSFWTRSARGIIRQK
ncbi:acyl-ACP--UDP-N-acetylglucosamine O-acyltransferase [Enterobacteriaceae bacterium H20N1]|uniref:Acyl-ACP--UDP-N-acetylglucosamine O-acyltransferase n=1 Tax=Dryocola boscaweniae TaxID=2925397 RepID=A0A9X3ACU9_9ENTR|nr:acyl-ACP--UDP-N-acetylglucosamine O-acyltransferase [Dryocola boscaweniae]MCT4702243.1 acyl-ACP--UDP-N-acetylglucosamine O-acyltransferase [Dryocola boscaweniae]MCT4719313.1 acyl-ACP--UDP-N-acetylglucosamine O-acyltransferase [Dryocola boscaweniae]